MTLTADRDQLAVAIAHYLAVAIAHYLAAAENGAHDPGIHPKPWMTHAAQALARIITDTQQETA